MSPLKLRFASQDYDRTKGLTDGSVKIEGIELEHVDSPPWLTFERLIKGGEFDVSEMGLTFYLGTLLLEDPPFIALPVFLSRTFRHSSIYINRASGILTPKDLIGKTVGEAFCYGHDAGVWSKDILSDEYGVPTDSYRYLIGGVDRPAKPWDWLPFKPPAHVDVRHIGTEHTLDAMLESGEIDALYSAIVPPSLLRRSPKVGRLFEDAEPIERDYYRRTGIHPIMHVVVIRRSVYREHPWIAKALYDGFKEAKEQVMTLHRAYEGRMHLLLMIPLLTELYERNREMFGADPWPYGLKANHKTLDTFLRYRQEQGLTKTRLAPEEIFAPETLTE